VRTKEYNQAGRNENEETAREYDVRIKAFLDAYPIKYRTVVCDDGATESIVKILTDANEKTH